MNSVEGAAVARRRAGRRGREKGKAGGEARRNGTFEGGYRSTCLVDAMLTSAARSGVWQKVDHVAANLEFATREVAAGI